MNITPEKISNLEPNEIFVFGSNLEGNHAGGAAKFAVIKFGAEMGNGNGIQGQSYAIPTLSAPAFDINQLEELKLPIQEIGNYVNKFIHFAESNPNLFFYVTPIGCGIAGFTEKEIAPLFAEVVDLDNVALPQSFINILKNENSMNNLNESIINKIVKNTTKKILREMNYLDTNNYYTLLELTKKMDEVNALLVGNDDINDIIQELYQIINNKIMGK